MSKFAQARKKARSLAKLLEPLRLGSRAVSVAAGAVSAIVTGTFVTAYLTVNPLWRPRRRLPFGGKQGFRTVSFSSADGIRLAGWYADGAAHDVTIILCHGWFGDKTDMLSLAEVLHNARFNVLAFDFRSWGESDRGPVTLGHREAQDVLGALRFLKEQQPAQSRRIGVFGLSMGAAAALMAAAQSRDIDAVVADSSYAGLAREVYWALRRVWGPLTPVTYVLTRWFGERLMRTPLPAVSPEQVISQIAPRPVLIIHGTQDRLIDVSDAHALYRSSGEPKVLWLIEGADHNETRAVGAQEYDDRVVGFFEQHLVKTDGKARAGKPLTRAGGKSRKSTLR